MIGTDKLGIFIVPTGIGATIGGYAGDASAWARRFSKKSKLIVNPNVVNAGGFSGINDNMYYVEGYALDEFSKGRLNLCPVTEQNRIGIVYDKAVSEDVLNVHFNTQNAVNAIYDINISGYEITEKPVGIEFCLDESGISLGTVKRPKEFLKSAKKLLQSGCNAIALVGMFNEPEELNENYANGEGTDPVGGVEAILSHYLSKELKIPCAHSPAFSDYQIYSDIVNPKSASEYITPTFLPCILLGLAQAPQLTCENGISIDNVDFIVTPVDALGNPTILEGARRGLPIYAIKENTTTLNITSDKLGLCDKITFVDSYEKCLDLL